MSIENKLRGLNWRVVVCSHGDSIRQYNIFDHSGFVGDIVKAYGKKGGDRDSFLSEAKRWLMYYFWSKCEWEVLLSKKDDRLYISPWIGRGDISLDVTDNKDFNWQGFYKKTTEKYVVRDNTVKIDVFDQVVFQWENFSDYLWKALR